MTRRNGVAIVLLLTLSTAWGCGGSDSTPAQTIPVKGKVTYKGQPVTSGRVVFEPEGRGREAHGEIMPDGTYELTSFNQGDGVPTGDYRVSVKGRTKSAKLPLKFGSLEASKIARQVAADKSDYPIELN